MSAIGNMELPEAKMMEAMQEWFDERYIAGRGPKVTGVSCSHGTFTVGLEWPDTTPEGRGA